MGKISTYSIDTLPTNDDKVIGSDNENSQITKNYLIGDILGLVPTPGLQEVLDIQNSATQNISLKGNVVAEQISSGVAFVSNGTSLFKGLNTFDEKSTFNKEVDLKDTVTVGGNVLDANGNQGVIGQVLRATGSQTVEWDYPPMGPADLQLVLDTGNQATQDLTLDGVLTTQLLQVNDLSNFFGEVTFSNSVRAEGSFNLQAQLIDSLGTQGTAGQVLSSTGSAIKWVNQTARYREQYVSSKIFQTNKEQEPTGQGTKSMVMFGEGGDFDGGQITPDGLIMLKPEQSYFFEFTLSTVTDVDMPGSAVMFFRVVDELNGLQVGPTRVEYIPRDKEFNQIELSFPYTTNSDEGVLSLQMMRSEQGKNDGKLAAINVDGGQWQLVPSASIQVWLLATEQF
jgi:hypothetical protein